MNADELGHRHLVLVGLMGVGKTTVGRIVAARLGRELVDSDARIEALTGRTVKQILDDDGVAALRRHEAAALFDAIDDRQPRVIAAAAGSVLDSEHRRRFRAASEAGATHVVWLSGDPVLLAPRATRGEHRPWLDDDPVGTLTRMHVERAPLYREVSDAVVEVDGLTPEAAADRILE